MVVCIVAVRLLSSAWASSRRLSFHGPVRHNDVRAVKDSAIVLSADRVDTVEAEPIAVEPVNG